MAKGDLVFLDIETLGLDIGQHAIWEIAYAVNDGPIISSFIPHFKTPADPEALKVNNYEERIKNAVYVPDFGQHFVAALTGSTVVGANPAFDTKFIELQFLRPRGLETTPWHHRLLDIEAYAMGVLNLDTMPGLSTICETLYITQKDKHTAAGDVETTRYVFNALKTLNNNHSMKESDLSTYSDMVFEVNHANGWFDEHRTFGEDIALLHSEVSEALEAYRNNDNDNLAEEFADIFIRLLDVTHRKGIDLEEEFHKKLNKNRSRGYRHGGKRL